ncbi:MAG: DNA polymerase I [Bacteroidia bacterium]|nr:DNA polymerase I [Bacteroidia bacterium]
MTSTKKLFLLDAMALIYRAYFAFIKNPMYNSKGLNTSAIYGFVNTLLDVIKKEEPTHIAVVFDTQAPTVRHEEFAEYKATREAMPEDLALSIPYIKQLIEAFNIPVLSVDGYEADDLIGTLAKKAEKSGFTTYMMTPDKDFAQLVSENIFIYKPAQFGNAAKIMGIAEVCEKFEIEKPEQVIDILGLWGDAVDNIPGIPGVGEKTAKKLIGEFGSIENVLDNTDKLKGKLKERVEENKEQAILSQKLATIICDVPIEFDEEELETNEPNKEMLKSLFNELEFRTLANKILGESIFENIDTVKHKYHLIDTPKKRKVLIEKLSKQKSFCFDTETTSLNIHEAELVGISFSFKTHEAYFVPFPDINNEDAASISQEKGQIDLFQDSNPDLPTGQAGTSVGAGLKSPSKEAIAIVREFKPVFENSGIEKTGQNLKYDISVLNRYDMQIKGKLFDTMLAHYLIEPDREHNMDFLAKTFLKYSPVSIETLIGKKGKDQLSMRTVPIEQLVNYACEDADITLQLKEIFEPLVEDNSNTRKIFDEIETPLIPVLASMEAEGTKLNPDALKELSGKLVPDIMSLQKEIYKLSGAESNIDSPKQVGEILFDKLKITDNPQKTKTGQYATGEDILTKLIGKHPIIETILEYRELQKLKNTYVDPLPDLINPQTGRIHTQFNQVVARTGRLSSDKPNLQNIPIRTERGREIRKAFVPRDKNYVLLSADYSQVELRIIAELSKDQGMLDAFIQGQDIHASTASKVYNVSIDDVTSEMRRNAKMVNFGIIYGISAFGLSQRLNIPRKEAAQIIEQYFIKYPKVKEYMGNTIEFAREHGYVETIMGRRRYLRNINDNNAMVRGSEERNAINAPIQGTAADMIKIAMINIYAELMKLKLKTKMTLQVHDELVFDVFKKEEEIVTPIIEKKMKEAIPMVVPLEVDMKTGTNWLEAHF